MTLLNVKNLTVQFPTPDGLVQAVHETSFEINPGETLAIVGESGSGKTVTNLALMGLIPARTANVTGSAIFESHDGPIDLLAMNRNDLRKYRGRDMAMIFQDPMSALHPFYTIGDQIMRQRVMIAMALVNNPSLLIADEPTTALDVTVQAQILKLLGDLQKEFKMAMILITHDMGVVAGAADRVNVMYAGRIVESANVKDLYANPLMPYTQGLLASVPRMDRPHTSRLSAIQGQPPSMIALPGGCSFNPRCSRKNEVGATKCESQMPELSARGSEHFARCFIGEGA